MVVQLGPNTVNSETSTAHGSAEIKIQFYRCHIEDMELGRAGDDKDQESSATVPVVDSLYIPNYMKVCFCSSQSLQMRNSVH